MVVCMSLIDIFRYNVRYYRFKKNYSQEKLAEMTGLSTHYISDIEQGKYSPSIPTIERISKALDILPQLLFTENSKAKNLSARVDIHRKSRM